MPMLMTREADYALRILRALSAGGRLTAGELSRGEQIPEQFAYKILKKLERAQLLTITRGKEGGCQLTADLTSVTLYDLLVAVGAESHVNMCTLPEHTCEWRTVHNKSCAIHERLMQIQAVLDGELRLHSLQQILCDEGSRAKGKGTQ